MQNAFLYFATVALLFVLLSGCTQPKPGANTPIPGVQVQEKIDGETTVQAFVESEGQAFQVLEQELAGTETANEAVLEQALGE